MQISAWVDMEGYLLIAGASGTTPAATGNFPLIPVTAVTGSPTWNKNGTPMTFSGPIGLFVNGDLPMVFWLASTKILSTDVITYSFPSGLLTTGAGASPAQSGTAINNVGHLETPVGGFRGYEGPITLTPGVNVASQPSSGTTTVATVKNKFKNNNGWFVWSGPGSITRASDGTPISWTDPGSTVLTAWVDGPTVGNNLDGQGAPGRPGQWAYSYIDPNVGTGTAANLTLECRGDTGTFTPVSQHVTGTTVYGIVDIQYISNPPFRELDVRVILSQSAGSYEITDLTVACPNAFTGLAQPIDLTDPYATDDHVLTAFRNMGIFRFMDSFMGYGGETTFVRDTNMLAADRNSWNFAPFYGVYFQKARFLNTDPSKDNVSGDGTYAWPASTKLYGPQCYFANGPDSFGKFSPLAAADDGAFLGWNNGNTGAERLLAIEFWNPTPHGLDPRVYSIFVATGPPSPVSVPMTNGTPFSPTGQSSAYGWPTGPNTMAFVAYVPDNVGGSPTPRTVPQTVASTSEIDLTAGGSLPGWLFYAQQTQSGIPIEYAARMVRQIGEDAILWANCPLWYDDTLPYAMGQKVAQYAPNNPILFELANERWNGTTEDQGWSNSLSKVLSYYPVDTEVFPSYTNNGLANDTYVFGTLVCLSQNALGRFKAGFAAGGGNPANVKHVVNVQWSYNFWANIVEDSLAQHTDVSFDYLAVAPYYDIPDNEPTLTQMFAPLGSMSGALGAPIGACMSAWRHIILYRISTQQNYSNLRAATSLPFVCYEGGSEYTCPPSMPSYVAVDHDANAHPSFAYVAQTILYAMQQGDQTVPNTGASAACYFSAYLPPTGGQDWKLAVSSSQPPGPGTSNLYATAQGGAPADGKDHNDVNTSPGLYGLGMFGAAPMGFAIVQSQGASGSGTSTTISATFGSTPTAPNQILVVVSGVVGSGTKPVWTISDSHSNSYTQLLHAPLAGIDGGNEGQTIDIWALNPTSGQVGSSFQITATSATACFPTLVILEVSYAGSPPTGGATGSASAGGASGTAMSCGNLTIPSNSAVLAIGTQLTSAGDPITVGSGYSSVYEVDYASGTTIGALLQSLLNTTATPAAPTMTATGGAVNWAMVALALTEQPITFTGPTSGTVGSPSTNFTITPSAAITDTFTPSISTISGTFTPTTLSWSNSASAKTFTFTPSGAGTGNVGGSFGNGYTVTGLPIGFTASTTAPTTATLTGPTSGTTGSPSTNFTATLDHPAGVGGVVVTPHSSVGGDTLTPTTVTIAQGASSGTFTLTASTGGARNISITTSPALTYSGSPIVYTATTHTWTLYGYDLFAGSANASLTGTTPDSGGSWPSDGNHFIGTADGILLNGSGGVYGNAGSGTAQLPSWAMPPANNFELFFDFVRLTSLGGSSTAIVSLTTHGTYPSTLAPYASIQWGEVGASLGQGFYFIGPSGKLGSTNAGPAVGTTWRIRARISTAGSNTTFAAAFSTDGGATYTDMGIGGTLATSGLPPIAVGFYAGSDWSATTGPQFSRLVLEDLSATTATLTIASGSGMAGTPVELTVTLDQPAGFGDVVVPVAQTGGTGTLSATSGGSLITSITITQGATTGTFWWNPTAGGTASITIGRTSPALTLVGSPRSYAASAAAATAWTLGGPTGGVVNTQSTNFTATPNGQYTGTLTITPSGAGLSTPIVLTYFNSAAGQNFRITPTTTGTVTLTQSNNGALTDPSLLHYVSSPAPTTWSYPSVAPGFAIGLGTVGYTVYAHDGSTYAARTTSGVAQIGAGINGLAPYMALVSLTFSGGYAIMWDDGLGNYYVDTVAPLAADTTGINMQQAMAIVLSSIGGKVSGNEPTGISSPIFLGADGVTVRLAGSADNAGNRSVTILSPPT